MNGDAAPPQPRLPPELQAALTRNEQAQANWDAAPPELQQLFVDHVDRPPRLRTRQERAADTALAAHLDTLNQHAHSHPYSWWDVLAAVLPFPLGR